MPGKSGISAVVSQTLLSVWEQSNLEDLSAVGDKLAGNLLDLLAISYSSMVGAQAEETCSISARRIIIRDFIEKNLSHPDLSPVFIAQALKFSVPYLHELFKGEGESICRYITRRRLEIAAKTLRDPQLKSISVSSIAYQQGFKSTTHFGRIFKQQFGCPPTEYR